MWKNCTLTFIAGLFIIAKKWNQCLSTEKWIFKNTVYLYSGILLNHKKEQSTNTYKTGMNPENFMVSERSQTQNSCVLFYWFAFGCSGSWLPCPGFSLVVASGGRSLVATHGVSHCGGSSGWGAWFEVIRLQSLWYMGLVAPWHVESSPTRDRTCVLCIGRRILNH